MIYDYPAPLYAEDEEEERKNRYPAPRPVAGPPGPPPGYTPISPEEQSQRVAALPAPEPRSDVALAYQPPQPPAHPRFGHEQTVQDQADLDRMKTQGSGVSQVGHGHGFLHGLARFGDVLGSILAPGITEQIPGTELHHRMLIHQREGDVGRDLAEEKEDAGTGLTEAETDEAKLRTKNLGEPKTQNPEEQAFQGYLKQGMNPMDAYRKIKDDAVKPPADKNTKEQLQAQLVEAQNKGDKAQAAKLRQQIKDIDPLGEQRVNISVSGQNFRENEALKKDAQPTAATRTMAETAPKVLDLSSRIRKLIEDQKSSLGPASSRWAEFMAGKVGAPNPEFTKLRTDVGLLQTALMRMHVGARGGEMMMQHFRDLIDSSKQDPENLMAALEEIEAYANEVKGGGTPAQTEQAPGAPPAGAEIIDYTHLK